MEEEDLQVDIRSNGTKLRLGRRKHGLYRLAVR